MGFIFVRAKKFLFDFGTQDSLSSRERRQVSLSKQVQYVQIVFNLNPQKVIKVAATFRVYTPQILTNHFLVFALHSTIGWKMLLLIYNCNLRIQTLFTLLIH